MAEQRIKIGAIPTRNTTEYTTTSYLTVTFRQLEIVNIGNNVYQSLADDNVGNALTDASKWVCLVDNDSYIEAEAQRQESFNESQAARTEAFNEAEAGRAETFSENEAERQAAIDAKLAEIDAIEFDDVPILGSIKAVKSNGIYEALNYGEIESVIYLSSLTVKDGLVANDTQWIITIPASTRTHVSIPVTSGEYYQIMANQIEQAMWMFLNTDQVPTTNLQTIDKVPGTQRYVLASGESKTFQIPEGCHYLVINKQNGDSNFLPSSLYKVSTPVSVKESVQKQGGILNDITTQFFSKNANWDIVDTDNVRGTLLSMELINGEIPDGSYIKYLGGRESVSGQFFLGIYDSNNVEVAAGDWIIPTDGTKSTLYTKRGCLIKIVVDGSKMKVNAGSTFYDWTSSNLLLNILYLKTFGTPKKIICFGDSITQFVDSDGKSYSDYLRRLSGCDVFNAGVGGTRLARRAVPTTSITTETEAWAAVDISNLVSAWVNNSWEEVDAAVTWLYNQNHSHDYRAMVASLKTIDISTVDIITIFGGTNDFTGDSKLGNLGSADISEISGALEVMFNLIQTANPKIEVFVFSPIVRYINNNRTSAYWSDNYVSTNPNLSGKKLPDIVDFIGDVCQYYHINFDNWYWNLGWNPFNFSNYFNSNDGTHPYKGFKYLGEKMFNYLKDNTLLEK